MKSNLQVKDDEVKVLWNVIKELNKAKGDKIDMSQLKSLVNN